MAHTSVSPPLRALDRDPDSISITPSTPPPADLEVAMSDIRPYGRDPRDGGAHSDIWQADLLRDGVSIVVALKVLRRNGRTRDVLLARFEQEVACLRILDHKNIAPLHCVCSNWHGVPAIVLPWYENGTASQFLQRHPNADPIPIIKDIAAGLAYMHDKRIVHGDLKGANVMIDDHERARLIDFGLARSIDAHVDGCPDVDPAEGFSIRWCAPELLLPGAVSTSSSDVYAFASTMFELLSGHVPYDQIRSETLVVDEVRRGTPPSSLHNNDFLRLPRQQRPGGSREPGALWLLMKCCWVQAARRPSMSQVKWRLKGF